MDKYLKKYNRFRKGQVVEFEGEGEQYIKGVIKRLNKETATVVFGMQEMRRIEYEFLKQVAGDFRKE